MPAGKWSAVAPSNIALIKYMGKTDASSNKPTNTSLSYTLGHLKSVVELEVATGIDRWEPLREYEGNGQGLPALKLSDKGAGRFLAHLGKLKEHFNYSGAFVVRSANDFPSDCGLASSASSFAALTMAALDALSDLTSKPAPPLAQAAELSRQGSGSSCRSFFAPWAIWSEREISAVPELGHDDLLHQVIVVDEDVKSVSSSEAHKRVVTSELFAGRPLRAERRVQALIQALRTDNWKDAFELSWAEFWDMHALFETARPSFGYMTAGSLETLRFVRARTWNKTGDGPIVTMDAGPNVHLLYRPGPASEAAASEIERELGRRFKVISSFHGERR